jgi:hypothetical protein
MMPLWITAATHAITAVDPPAVVETHEFNDLSSNSVLTPNSSATAQQGQNWSGHIVHNYQDPNGANLTTVGAEWGVPPVPNTASYCGSDTAPSVTEWVGLDGVGNNDLTQAGTESESCFTSDYRFFTEDTATQGSMVFQGPSIGPQELALVWVSHPATGNGTSTYLLENVTENTFQVKTLSNTPWLGNAAEFIVERPQWTSCGLFSCNSWYNGLANYDASWWSACFYADTTGNSYGLTGGPGGNDIVQMYQHPYGGPPQLNQTGSVSNQFFTSTWLNFGGQVAVGG